VVGAVKLAIFLAGAIIVFLVFLRVHRDAEAWSSPPYAFKHPFADDWNDPAMDSYDEVYRDSYLDGLAGQRWAH